MRATIMNDGHPDPHYPSWGYGHLCSVDTETSSGSRAYVRVFHHESLPPGTEVEVDTTGWLLKVRSTVLRVAA